MPAHPDARTEIASALRCLVHPLSLVALVLLGVNDHLWKGVGPGWLTGKLSDVCGLFFFPFLVTLPVALVVRRRDPVAAGRIAFWIVGLWFAGAKTIPVLHQATVWIAEQALGPIWVARDPTDLLALLALVPAWRLYRAVARTERPVRQVIAAPVLMLTLLLTAATQRPRVPSVAALIERDGTLHAVLHDVWSDDVPWTVMTTRDGYHWETSSPLTTEIIESHQPRTELVTASGLHIVLRGREVAAKRGGRLERIWSIPEERHDLMTFAGARNWSARDVAGLPGRPGVIVVAFGSEGVLVGDGRTWTRVGVGPIVPTEPESSWGSAVALIGRGQWIFGLAAAVIAATVLCVLTWFAPRRPGAAEAKLRSGSRWAALRQSLGAIEFDLVCALAAAFALGTVWLVLLPGPYADLELGAVVLSILLACGLLALAGGAKRYRRIRTEDGAPPPRVWPRLIAVAVAVGAFAIAVVIACQVGWIHGFGSAIGIIIATAVLAPVFLRPR